MNESSQTRARTNETIGLTEWEKIRGAFEGVPGFKRRRSTIDATIPLIGTTTTYVVETWHTDDQDFLFLQIMDAKGGQRIALPPEVVHAIYNQRRGIVRQVRKDAAKRAAQTRAANGLVPFQRVDDEDDGLGEDQAADRG